VPESFGIALVGCGVVGGGVAQVLLTRKERLAQRAGRPLVLRRIVVRDLERTRSLDSSAAIPKELISADLNDALADPAVEVVVELIGGTTTAKKVVLAALAAGKHVVTANKALLADAGGEVFEAARRSGKTVCFEAAVAGGVPIIRALAESLAANQVTAIQGILNGTSNFILTAMAEGGKTYAAALAEAQKLGYAEADPTLDVDGSDAAHKLAVLAQIAFGVAARRMRSSDRESINSTRWTSASRSNSATRSSSWRRPGPMAGKSPCMWHRCCSGTRRCSLKCAAPTTPC